MRPLIREIQTAHTPESLVERLGDESGGVLLRTSSFDSPQARYSFVAVKPFLTFRSFGSRCEIVAADPQPSTLNPQLQFGNPWHLLDSLMSRFELLDEIDLPFPLGGCFGYWGYDLKNFTEPKLPRRAVNDLELPDCHVGFYDSLVVFDHCLGKTWIVSTGLAADGSRSEKRAREQMEFWRERLENGAPASGTACWSSSFSLRGNTLKRELQRVHAVPEASVPCSNLSRSDFLAAVERAQAYIRAGDIYQVNLSQRLTAPCDLPGWELFQKLSAVSPAPFAIEWLAYPDAAHQGHAPARHRCDA